MVRSKSSYARPIRLPMELPYPRRTDMWFAVTFTGFVALHILAFAILTIISIVSGQLKPFLLLFPPVQLVFLCVAVGLIRSAAAQGRLGAGILRLDHFGLWDTRLSDRPIAWTAFDGARLVSSRRKDLVSVCLHVGRQEDLPPMNDEFRRAFQPFTDLRRSISIDLVRFARKREIAQLIIDVVADPLDWRHGDDTFGDDRRYTLPSTGEGS